MTKQPEIYRILKSFNRKDFIAFDKYLSSPYLNPIEALSLIFKIIRKNQHLILRSKFEELENLLFKNSGYSKSTVIKLLSYLSNSVFKYYGLKSVLEDGIYCQIKLNEYLLNKGEYKLLHLNQVKLNSTISDPKIIGDDTFLFSHFYNVNLYDTSISGKFYMQGGSDNASEVCLFNSSADLFFYTITQTVSNYVNFNLQKINFNKVNLLWTSVDIDDLIKTGEKYIRSEKNHHRIIFFNLYKNLFYAYKFIDRDEYYNKYKSYFLKNLKNFNKDIINQHYKCLINYCTARERTGDKKNHYSYEWIILTNQLIDVESYNEQPKKFLHSVDYHNFILRCSALNDSSKLKEFIDKYTVRLAPKEYRNMLNFGLSHYYNLIADYGKALKCINSVKINSFMFKYDILKLELQIYYEKSKIDLVERAVHNYKEMIKHDSSITKYDKTRLFNMLKYYQGLIYLKEKLLFNIKYIGDVHLLKDQIENEPGFDMKNWINAKVAALIEKYDIKAILKDENQQIQQ